MTGPRIGRRRAALAAAAAALAGEAGRGACPARRLSDAPAPPGRHLPARRRDRHRRPHHRRGPGSEARPAGGGGEPPRRRRQYRRAGGRGGRAGRLHPAARHRRDARGQPGALREFRRRCGARFRHDRHHQRHGERALREPPPARREDRGGAGRDRKAPPPGLRLGRQRQLVAPFGGDPAARTPASPRRTCPIAAPRRRWRRCSAAEFDFLFDTTATSTAHVRSGTFRALAVTSPRRAFALPEVPTMQEAGIAGYDLSVWNALFVHRRTPQPVLARLQRRLRAGDGRGDASPAARRLRRSARWCPPPSCRRGSSASTSAGCGWRATPG